MKGVVVKSTGTWYQVYISEKDIQIAARLKGIFRTEGIRDTNPISIGDEVTLDVDQGDYVINHIADRRNYVIRQSPKHRALRHIIAANVDLAAVVVSISRPRTSTGFIDRFLVTTEAYQIPSVIIINKVEELRSKDLETYKDWKSTYESLGYQVIGSSTYTGEGIDDIKSILKGKRTLFSGHSGVGKSSILNTIDETLDLSIGEISRVHEKGMHTTTFSELFRLKDLDAEIIDTPGIKEFGLLQMEDHELKDYFREFLPYLNQCKFNNCFHINEPECKVYQALLDQKISLWRYKNYLNILSDIRESSDSWELKKRDWVKR